MEVLLFFVVKKGANWGLEENVVEGFPLPNIPVYTIGQDLAPADKKVKIYVYREKRSHFEGTNTPSKGF